MGGRRNNQLCHATTAADRAQQRDGRDFTHAQDDDVREERVSCCRARAPRGAERGREGGALRFRTRVSRAVWRGSSKDASRWPHGVRCFASRHEEPMPSNAPRCVARGVAPLVTRRLASSRENGSSNAAMRLQSRCASRRRERERLSSNDVRRGASKSDEAAPRVVE